MGESIVYAIKCALIVAAAATFFIATSSIFSYIAQFTSHTIISEVLGIISMCLPFNANTFFGTMFGAFNVILSWVLARKLFSLNRKGVEST